MSGDEQQKETTSDSGSTSQVKTESGNVSIFAVSPKLPEFWSMAPEAYFLKIEASFRTANIKVSSTKYDRLIEALPQNVAVEMIDVMRTCDNSQTPYEDMKNALLQRYTKSESSRIESLLSATTMGDRSPSAFYRHMLNTAGSNTNVSSDLVRTLWMRQLPAHLQIALQAFTDKEISLVLDIADKIHEVASRNSSVYTVETTGARAVDPISELKTEFNKQLSEIRSLISELSVDSVRESRPRERSFSRNRNDSRSRSARSDDQQIDPCWYHETFGDKARKCRGAPCRFYKPKN